MNKNSFTEEDKEKVIEFLNMIAKKAKFEMDTTEVIQYFKLLSFMQSSILPKINDHILEVKRVVEAKPEEKPEPKSKGRKKT